MRLFGYQLVRAKEKRSPLKDPDDKIRAALGGAPLLSGVTINEDSALSISAVFACARILAETLAQLPLRVMRKTATGSEEATDHPAFSLLKRKPNDWQSSFDWREMMQGMLALRGNAFAYVKRDGTFAPIGLIPLNPNKMRVVRLPSNRQDIPSGIAYQYSGQYYAAHEILHLRGLSSDGFVGLSPVTVLRETMGLPKALEQSTAALMGNGVRPSGVLEHPEEMGDEAQKRLRSQFDQMYSGTPNAGRTIVLEEGMKWHQIGMTFEDAQLLESKKFSVEEIARIYRVPLHMLQSTEKSTSWGTGIEQMTLGFVQFTMQPWLTRWEQTLGLLLLREEEQEKLYVKFDLRSLQRGDHKSRMEGYALGLLNGIYSINEVRRLEDMDELPDHIGGVHRVPANTLPAGQEADPKKDDSNKDDGEDDLTQKKDEPLVTKE